MVPGAPLRHAGADVLSYAELAGIDVTTIGGACQQPGEFGRRLASGALE